MDRIPSKPNKLANFAIQVQYHVSVIYSLGGRHTQAAQKESNLKKPAMYRPVACVHMA